MYAKLGLKWKWFIRICLAFGVIGLLGIIGLAIWLFNLARDLPDYRTLAEYVPQTTSRVHAGDGKLIAEFAQQNRVYVPYDSIPDPLIDAFISAEDKRFFLHNGLDYKGIMRAAIKNINNMIMRRGGNLSGGSTITQQVAKNMLLNREQRLERKAKEAILTLRIEHAFSKEQILSLYLNEIYLGGRSYGVAAAALNYYDKSLSELSIAECAMLAGLAQRPGRVNPLIKPDAAIERRNWVISRMQANDYLTREEAAAAMAEPLYTKPRLKGKEYSASAYFVEEIRRELLNLYGEEAIYQGGLSVRTTLDTHMQLEAQNALRHGLEVYDRRHEWRGPIVRLDITGDISTQLASVERPSGAGDWNMAVLTQLEADTAIVESLDGKSMQLASSDVTWALRNYVPEKVGRPRKGLEIGDVVFISTESLNPEETDQTDTMPKVYLRQIPTVEGALLAMDPHTGRILAMVGGYSFWKSQFNRVTQANRQPGSAFKPFVYAAALDTGFTPNSRVIDAPFVICDPNTPDKPCYMPSNYSTGRFYGETSLRTGMEKSLNAMTVRMAQEIGIKKIIDYGVRFGIYDSLPPYLSMALGAGETNLVRMVGAYASLINGGYTTHPTLLDRVQDRYGRTLYRNDQRECIYCLSEWNDASPPELPNEREQIIDPITAYQIVSMMEGVVQRGTGTIIRTVGKPLAGKTGTTNDYFDAWFIGFSPDLVVGIYVGYDTPKTLGENEAGGRVAAPIFRDFMKNIPVQQTGNAFRIPSGVRLVEIDAETGQLPDIGTRRKLLEAFRPGTEPRTHLSNRSDEFFMFGRGYDSELRKNNSPISQSVIYEEADIMTGNELETEMNDSNESDLLVLEPLDGQVLPNPDASEILEEEDPLDGVY